jgi:aryl carrier-like protein
MSEYDGQTDSELEARADDLYQQIMAGFDSLPLATWTPEYRAAHRDIQAREIQFRALCIELARRSAERAARWNETMDAALKGIIDGADDE